MFHQSILSHSLVFGLSKNPSYGKRIPADHVFVPALKEHCIPLISLRCNIAALRHWTLRRFSMGHSMPLIPAILHNVATLSVPLFAFVFCILLHMLPLLSLNPYKVINWWWCHHGSILPLYGRGKVVYENDLGVNIILKGGKRCMTFLGVGGNLGSHKLDILHMSQSMSINKTNSIRLDYMIYTLCQIN